MKKHRKEMLLTVGIVVMFSLFFIIMPSGAEAAEKIVIKVGSFAPDGSFVHKVVEIFKKKVEERTAGKVEIIIFPAAQLGSMEAVQEGMRIGTHQMGVMSSPINSLVPQFGLFDFPFLIDDRKKVERIVNGPIGEELFALLKQKGLIGLSFFENGFNQMTNNKRPIQKPEDLKGLKMRVPNAPSRMLIYKGYGASPTPLPFTEAFTALQQGVADGQDNPYALIKDSKMYEVQKYLSKTYQYYSVLPLVASKIHWDKWPADVQGAIKQSAVEAASESRKLGKAVDDECLEFLKKHMQVNEVDREAFKKASDPIYDALAKDVGKDLLVKLKEAVK